MQSSEKSEGQEVQNDTTPMIKCNGEQVSDLISQ